MKNSWLEIAEYITIAGSIAGSAVAVLSQQLVYAAAPVSASLLLNLLNRRRLEELAPPSPNGDVTQIHRQLSTEVESLRASVRRLPTHEELRGVKEALQIEMRRLEGLETAEGSAAGEISHIHNQYSSLLEAVATVSNRLEEFPPASRVEGLEKAFARTTEELAQLENEVTQLQTNLQNRQAQSSTEEQVLTAQAYSLLEQQLEQLRTTLAQVQQDAQNRVPAQDFNSLVAAMQVLEQAVAPAAGAISDIQAQLDALSEQVNRQSNETLQTTTLQQLEEIRGALAGLERRIDLEKENFTATAALSSETTELAGIEALAPLSNAVEDMRLELDDLRSQIRQRSGVTLPADISQQLEELRASLSELTQRVETVSTNTSAETADVAGSEALAPLSNALEDMRLELDDLRSQIRQRSGVTLPTGISEQLDELRVSLSELTKRVETGSINTSGETTELAGSEALAPLSNALEDMRLELDDLRSQIKQRSGVTLPAGISEQLDELRASLSELTQRVETGSINTSAETADVAGSEAIAPLSNALEDMRLELDDLRSQIRQRSGVTLPAGISEQLEELRASLSELTQRVETVSTTTSETADVAGSEAIAPLSNALEDMRLELDDLRSQIRQRTGVTLPAGISEQLDELRVSLSELTQRVETGSINTSAETADVAGSEALAPLSNALEDMRLELDDLRSQLRQRTGVTLPAGISEQLDELRESFNQLNRRVDQPASAQTADLAGIEEVLAKIAQSVADSKAQIESRLIQLEAREINPLGQDVAQLQHEYASLLASIAGLIARLDSLPPASRLDNLETTLAQLVQRIETLPTESVEQPMPVNPAIEGQIEEFRSALAELERTIQNPAPQAATTTALEETVAEIQAELDNLRAQVNQPLAAIVPVDSRLEIEEVRGVVDALNRRIDDLPLPEPVDFTGVEEVLGKIAESVAEAKARMENRLAQLEAEIHNFADLEPVPGNLLELREQYAGLLESVAGVTTRLESSPSAAKIDELERAITEAWERIAYLQTAFAEQQSAPASVEVEQQLGELRSALGQLESSLEHLATKAEVQQHLGDIQKLVSELRQQTAGANTDWQQLRQDVQSLQQQVETLPVELQERISAELQEPLNALSEQFNQRPERQQIEELRESLTQLYRRINVETQNYSSEPASTGSADLTEVESILTKIAEAVAEAKSQMESRIAEIQSVDVDSLQGDISGLHAALDRLETGHIAALEEAITRLQTDLETVSNRPTSDFPSLGMSALLPVASGLNPDVESGLAGATTELANIQLLVTQAVENQLGEINQLLKALQTWEFKLVFDRPGIRAVLEEALETTQERLIVVCPWVSRSSLDGDLLRKFEAFLERNGRLDIGWGNLKDIDSGEFPRKTDRQWQSNDESDTLYDALNDLEQLQSKYPSQLRLKVLGTNENYLVSDSTSAMLTTHNFLSAGAGFPEREVGVLTTDPRIIQGLIDRFDDPVLNPNNAYAYRKRGFERLDSGDAPSAIEDYTQALELDANNANVYNNRGVARSNLGEHAAAIEDYTQALLINPNEGAYYFNRGFSRSHIAEYAGAIADFTEAIRLLPEDADSYFQRGEAYRLLGQYQNAVADYTQALQLNPRDAIAHNNRGLAYYELGNRQAAIEDYNHALQINPDDAVAYFNRGIAFAAGGDYAGAIADFNHTLTHHLDHAGAYHNRGLARAEIGDRPKAIEDIQNAAHLFSTKGDTDSAQQALETLKKLQS
ncbi:tetratricopeptide repeat protein [Microcoleus sp. FACHB-68]|uniref:tetratricopeptide repeat protein n=1 Tax=Microcoleus sp. FACHB-68 TaxID=2692826 RepID=UPI0016879A5A|nr:tetratricopeptide repeat protein [Microcoleus sp. FACHB-68]MBD1939209.1 tetratricopeptide repeat protein [Microcoleus sp. FACHB-68]